MSNFSARGSGILLLNSQIKKTMPHLSITERAKEVTGIWSKLDKNKRDDMCHRGRSEWICDPDRKEFAAGAIADSYEMISMFDSSIPLVQFQDGGHTKRIFIRANGDDGMMGEKNFAKSGISGRPTTGSSSSSSSGGVHEASTHSNLQLMRRVLAEELSHQSSDIPEKYMKGSRNTAEMITFNESIKKRRKRLRSFAAKGTEGWSGTIEEVFDRAQEAIEADMLQMKKKNKESLQL